MKGSIIVLLLVLVSFFTIQESRAQEAPTKIAVFAPLYLDSAFNGNNFKLGNTNLPKFLLPGLEFYNGVMMAIDSLNAEGVNAEVLIYDSKQSESAIQEILSKPELEGVSLIIASFNNRNEIKALADFALSRKIALISETYPNDGGVTENPYFVLVNSTLRTHIDALYKYLQRVHSTDNLIWIKRKGALEDMIQSFFTELQKKTPSLALRIKTVEMVDSLNQQTLLTSLDSNRNNVLICGSLNEPFGTAIVKTLADNKDYKGTVIGMPTWDGFKDLAKPEYKGIEIIYSSPYHFPRTDKISISISNKYRNKFQARPSDQVFKGFESMYHFSKLLIKHKEAFLNNLSNKSFKVFNDFDIQPIRFKRDNPIPDYLENKKIYILKKQDGQIKPVF
jgi:ABC-type branched-subunit amino acid transport system substrate-binding protein